VGRYSAERQLYADHLTIGLSLTVDSLPKTESQEFHFIFFASLKQFYLIFEVCDLGTVNLQYMGVFWIWNPVLCIYSSGGHRSDLLSRSIIFTNSIKKPQIRLGKAESITRYQCEPCLEAGTTAIMAEGWVHHRGDFSTPLNNIVENGLAEP